MSRMLPFITACLLPVVMVSFVAMSGWFAAMCFNEVGTVEPLPAIDGDSMACLIASRSSAGD